MNARVRILHVVDSLGNGGLERGLVNVIRNLDRQRFEHVVCAIRALGPNSDRLRDYAEIHCLRKDESPTATQLKPIARLIRSVKPDIVHSRNWSAIEAVAAARFVRRPAIIHSEHGVDASQLASDPRRRVVFRRLAFELADRVFCVSHQLRDLLARRTGFPARRIGVIHNGVDIARFRPDPAARAEFRASLNIADSEFCIGAVGNLRPVKDHLTLLKAAQKLEHCRVLIAGEGPELPRLEEFLNAHPDFRKRVHLVGACHRIPEFLNALDAYVLPSLSEGISNSLLEAMASGLPCLATNTGGNPEVILDGVSGILFPVGDADSLTKALTRVHAGMSLRQTLAAAAIDRARNYFSIASMIAAYSQLYSEAAPSLRALAKGA